MKAAVVCICFFALAWALPLDQDELHFKHMHVNPSVRTPPIKINGRITNGVEAAPHSIPYQAYLIVTANNGRWTCGGSLISPSHVLTAAHCVENSISAVVYLGSHNIQKDEDSRVVVESRNLISHQDYDENTISNDIGLVVLDGPVELNDFINVVRLPSREPVRDFEGENARVSGWGLVSGGGSVSPVLLEVNTTVMSNSDCGQIYNIVIDSQICTSGVGDVGICDGDSGGPLVFENTQIGIVSYRAGYCLPGYPSGYTRVTSYLDWIEENTGLTFN